MTSTPPCQSVPGLMLCLLAALLLGSPRSTGAASPAQIDEALNRGKAFLYGSLNAAGNWERVQAPTDVQVDNSHSGAQWGGRTAMAVYALLAAGERHDEPRLARAIDFMKSADIKGTYAVAMRMLACSFLPRTDEVRRLIARDATFLLSQLKTTGNAAGHFDYYPGRTSVYSHSRSQYGALGLWVAAKAGVEVPRQTWQLIEAGWVRNQDPSGGWRYKHRNDPIPHEPTPGMTAAGVATLFITGDFNHSSRGLDCRPGGGRNIPALDRGMEWMARNMKLVATDERYDRDFPYATLYAVERIGVASGLKYIGDVDWFRQGAAWLVARQRRDGSWSSGSGPLLDPHVDTCFAMLFLARGRAPVMMSKLRYTLPPRNPRESANELAWNNRPRDVANLVDWTARQLERDLNWQIADIDKPVRDLHDAPLLLLGGNEALNFNDQQKAKLKQYIEEGGLVVGHADCRDEKFARSFLALGSELFPPLEFRELPDNHPIYAGQNFSRARWRRKPSVQSLGNGVREFMVLLRDDPARRWQSQDLSDPVAFELPANLYLYAIDKQFAQVKGQTYLVDPDPKVTPTRSVRLARLQHPGDWDPEPAGWRRLAAILRNRHKVDLAVETVPLGQGKLSEFKVAHLTGTRSFQLEPPQRDEILRFVRSGGTLLIDAAGGSGEFATAVEAELATMFPDARPTTLPPDHPLFSAGGTKLAEFRWRNHARVKVGGLSAPRLRAIDVNGRAAVIYSPDDLSAGWMGAPVDGIVGYAPETATEIGVRLVLFASPGQ